jgi:hypothetical protein
MLPAKPIEHFASRLAAASLRVGEPALDSLNRLHALEELLVGFGVLDDDLGSAVDRQDQGIAGLLEPFQELRRISLEIAERPNVIGDVQHEYSHQICIEFDDRTQPVVLSKPQPNRR